jgi:hypothetical protein
MLVAAWASKSPQTRIEHALSGAKCEELQARVRLRGIRAAI